MNRTKAAIKVVNQLRDSFLCLAKIDVVDVSTQSINAQRIAAYSPPGTPKLGADDGSIALVT